MSDVVWFPQLVRSSALSNSGLTEAHDTVSNFKMSDLYGNVTDEDADESTQSTETNVAFLQDASPLPVAATGWSNQELADLYRTQRILALAGVTTQVDRGVTDEGDPWFVFMDSQHEVLVHFSRFDGFYLVTSHMQEEPIKGHSLQDLVTEFSRRIQPVAQAGDNVVSIGKRNRDVVFIHPAAALAALVWSVYLMADELIAATPMIAASAPEGADAQAPKRDGAEDLTGEPEGLATTPAIPPKAPVPLTAPDMAKQTVSSNREGLVLGASGHGAKAVGVSLSLVALAVGLPLPASSALEVTDENGAPRDLSWESFSAALTQVKAKEADLLMASETIELKQRQMDLTEPANEEAQPEGLNIDPQSEAAETGKVFTATHKADAAHLPADAPKLTPNLMPRGEGFIPAEKDVAAVGGEMPPAGLSSSDTKEISFLQDFDAAFEGFKITSLDRIAQNELAELIRVEDADNTSDTLIPFEDLRDFGTFDQEAIEFLDFLLHTYSNIKVVNLATEIIFIHMDAFEGDRSAHEIYAKSWSFDDGGTISTIGFKSDMAQFDLIA